MQKCCVNTVLYHRASNTKDINYRCMTRAIVDANVNMKMGDFEVTMHCIGKVRSGAMALAGASVASLVAMTLY